MARANDGKFILRIEDTDQARKIEGAEEAIETSLSWLGITWDEKYTQSGRLDEYKKHIEELINNGNAYEDDGAVRFKVEKEGKTSWTDAIGNKNIEFDNSEIEDFIILKKDGFPTYHLANVVDDHLMKITHVIRGEDWIPSAPKHIMLYNAFGWELPVFAHVPNVLATDRSKLSKRRGAKSVLDFKSEGILPLALLNYLMLLGWSPKDDRELLTKEEIVREFKLENINIAPAVFDERKLLWMNGEYIRKTENSELKDQILEFDPTLGDYDPELIFKLIEPAKTRMGKLSEFRSLVEPFVAEVTPSTNQEVRDIVRKSFESIVDWTHENILNELKRIKEERNLSWQEVYGGIIGRPTGLSLPDVFLMLGKDATVARLK